VPAPAPDPAPGVEEEIAAAPAGEAPAEIEERHAIPLSVADESAEVISEPWRLAAERAPEPAEPVAAASAPEDETIAMDQEPAAADEAVEPPEEEDVLPRFELGEPGTGLEDMKVDMRPAEPSRDFALGVSTPEEPLDESHEPSSTFADIEAELAATEQLHAGRTMRISPEEVDAALRGPEAPAAVSMPEPVAPLPPPLAQAPAEPVAPPLVAQVPIEPVAAPPMAPMPAEPAAAAAPAPASDAWEPPEGLAAEIAAFNARHVIVFRALRTEVGAGAANFVRSCRASLGHGLSELFAGAELRADGSWDPDALRRAVVEHRMAEAPTAFRQLLEREMERLRDHLGEKRAYAIAGQLAAIP
jgi:2-oxoglutarate dehydrogenase E2 component (dihydrolipoamide succinyltransferase)